MQLSDLKNDSRTEAEGVWVNYGGGLRLKIARANNPKYEEYLRQLSKPHMRRIARGNLDNEVMDEITRKATARYILLGWEGLTDDKGKEIPFSEAKALEFFADPNLKDFYRDVTDLAQDRSLFRAEALEEQAKN